jgi:branched-chain amino acid transport system permease protein
VLSAAIVAVGGSLYAHSLGVVSPNLFYFELTFTILTIVIIGGRSISGVVAGALIVTAVTELLRRLVTGLGDGNDHLFALVPIGPAVIVLLILSLRPEGLLGRWELDELLKRPSRLQRRAPDAVA